MTPGPRPVDRHGADRGAGTPRVLVLGAHANDAPSMHRYTATLMDGYAATDINARLLTPPNGLSRRAPGGPLRKFAAYLEVMVCFPFAARRGARRADVVHVADHSHAYWLLAVGGNALRIATCHDLIAVRASLGEIPEHVPRASGRALQRLIRRGLRSADVIESISEATGADARRLVGPGRSYVTVHIPVSPTLAAGSSSTTASSAYFLVVGSDSWRKRRDIAVQMWAALREDPRLRRHELVVVGPALSESELGVLAGDARQQIRVRPSVTDDELAALYAGATGLIQMSQHEGFGWPIVEAQAQGTPVVCSDIPVFREIAGGGAVFVRPEPNTWTVADLADQILDTALSRRARENAARFSADSFAAGVAAVVGAGGRLPADG